MTVFKDIEISLSQQCLFFLLSIALGTVIGAFYDVFRILRIAVRHNAAVIFFEDILFCAVTCCMLMLLIFCANYGVVRWFSIFGCVGGFMLYRETAGKAVVGCAEIIIRFVKKYIILPIKRLRGFVLGALARAAAYIASRIRLCISKICRAAFKMRLLKSARGGFGL